MADAEDAEGKPTGTTVSGSITRSLEPTRAYSRSVQQQTSEGWNQTFKTIYKTLPTELYTLDELRHQEAISIMDQERRHAVAKIPGQRGERIITSVVREHYARPRRVAEVCEGLADASDYTSPLEAIEQELNMREMKLITEVKAYLNPPEPEKDEFQERIKRLGNDEN